MRKTKGQKAIELLRAAIEQWEDRFDDESDINGADCVDWLAQFIMDARIIIGKKRARARFCRHNALGCPLCNVRKGG